MNILKKNFATLPDGRQVSAFAVNRKKLCAFASLR
jgi:hypothetical protein